jgi:Barrel-sandwich domain of CusB or HlyD membrane-fusion
MNSNARLIMSVLRFILPGLVSGLFMTSCGQRHGVADEAGDMTDPIASTDRSEARTPVTVTTVSHAPLEDFFELNAVSAFLQKSYVKANANGYLQTSDAYPGKYVEPGQRLFTLQTKEAQTLGNSIRSLDSSFKFTGIIPVLANQHGYITQLNHQPGDYVQDGEQLAVISDRSSFVFLLELPYELKDVVQGHGPIEVILPDGQRLEGTIGRFMPSVDSASQTQQVVIRVNTQQEIPESLIAKVRILKTVRNNTTSLPRAAVLTDETESNFWVMKMTDSSTAVKVSIKKGLETQDRVEIVSPPFSATDRILITGNYGLPDTAKVKIEEAKP